MPKKGGSGSKDVTSDNKYRIIDKDLTNPLKAEQRARKEREKRLRARGGTAEDEGDAVEGTSLFAGKDARLRKAGTYAHLVVEHEDDDDDGVVSKALDITNKDDPIHPENGNFYDTSSGSLGKAARKIIFSIQTSTEFQFVIFISVLLEASLTIAFFIEGENDVFPESDMKYIGQSVLYLLILDFVLKVLHKAGMHHHILGSRAR